MDQSRFTCLDRPGRIGDTFADCAGGWVTGGGATAAGPLGEVGGAGREVREMEELGGFKFQVSAAKPWSGEASVASCFHLVLQIVNQFDGRDARAPGSDKHLFHGGEKTSDLKLSTFDLS
ncbi:MAG: hypothetical protein Kow00109_28320 [Acidobacteriota bacterium]